MLFYQKRNNTSALGRKFAKDENIIARQGINCAILLIRDLLTHKRPQSRVPLCSLV